MITVAMQGTPRRAGRHGALGVLLLGLTLAPHLQADVADHHLVSLAKQGARASSTLREKGRAASYYAADKAVDGNLKTAWCADAKGDSIKGESLTLEFKPRAADGLIFFSGIGASGKLFRANNRITKATLAVTDNNNDEAVYTYEGDGGGCYDARDPAAAEDSKGKSPCFFDVYGEAGSPRVGFSKYTCVKKVVLTILAVARGSVYDDTCISEIALTAPGGGDPAPAEFIDFARGCQ